MNRRYKKRSSFETMLRALIPYTKENIALSFKPSEFYRQLSKVTDSPVHSLESAMSRAVREGYVEKDSGVPILTDKGQKRLGRVYESEPMKDGNYFLVVYDIPNEMTSQRRMFTTELKAMGFKQYQKSMWLSAINHKNAVIDLIAELSLGPYITCGTFARAYGIAPETNNH